jgi:hypothetical protein
VTICEISPDYVEALKVIGVIFTYDEDQWGAVITAIKTLKKSNSPFIIHTPWKPAVPSAGGEAISKCLPNITVKLLEDLQECAKEYINGERAQQELFADRKEKKARGLALVDPSSVMAPR